MVEEMVGSGQIKRWRGDLFCRSVSAVLNIEVSAPFVLTSSVSGFTKLRAATVRWEVGRQSFRVMIIMMSLRLLLIMLVIMLLNLTDNPAGPRMVITVNLNMYDW